MERDQDFTPRLATDAIPVYISDTTGGDTEWIARAMEDAGFSGVTELARVETLSHHTRELLYSENAVPLFAIIATPKFDPDFIALCRRFLRLTQESWIGIVAVVYGPQAPEGEALSEAGCLDILHLPEQKLPDQDIFRRLRLAMSCLHERRLRLEQARSCKARIAEHRIMEARLNYLASHDELTDLANRSTFEKALDKAILIGVRRKIPHALLYIDLDRFKLHNDAAGHGSGNYLLQTVANCLRSALPQEYLLARLGSDEFAVLLQGADEAEAQQTAEQLRALTAGIEPDGGKIVYHVGISIGLTLIRPGAIACASQALAQAEQACFAAKTRGGNTVHTISQEDDILQHLREDMHWAQPIRLALSRDQLFLAFQPILDIKQQHISHYEALVRIPQQLGGDDQSARFMLAAERLGLAQQVDLWVVSNAIDYLASNGDISLGVNLSSHAFQKNALLPLLQKKLRATRIAPERLTFEITETAAIMNFADTRRMVSDLRHLGCRFALDDFGSGFSTYHYIKQFPIDMLKIDGSFIVNVKHDQEDQAIVQSMIEIAHGLDKEVVAEFIEDAATLGLLSQMGIDHAQGYYIGRPTQNPTSRPFPADKEKRQ
ncbi:MAG: EAL domain-containing protein [Candidatus Thiodiazotropha sp.]